MGVKVADPSSLVDDFTSSMKAQQDRQMQQQDMMLKHQQALYAGQANDRANAENTRQQSEHDQALTDLATKRAKNEEDKHTQMFGEEAETLASLPSEKRKDYYDNHLIPTLTKSGYATHDMPPYSDDLIHSWRMNALTAGERSTERMAQQKLNQGDFDTKVGLDGNYYLLPSKKQKDMSPVNLGLGAPPQVGITQGPNGPVAYTLPKSGAQPTGTPIMGPGNAPITQPLKEIPETVKSTIRDNQNQLGLIDQIQTAFAKPGQHTGAGYSLLNSLPLGVGNIVANQIDPEGTQGRQLLARIGSIEMKAVNGQRITANEIPRLRPWIPQLDDSPPIRDWKLKNFKAEALKMNSEISQEYTTKQGYREDPLLGGQQTPTQQTAKYKAGDKRTNSHGDPMIFDGTKWGLKQ
jgi:hypothetical protein